MSTFKSNSTVKQSVDSDGRVGRELLMLIDEFEEFLDQRPRIPLTGKIMFDEDDIYGFVDHLRRAIPKEIKRAMEILAERDRIIQAGEAEAESMVAQARQYVQQLTDESVISRQAEEEAARIISKAHEEARAMRREAEQYAESMLDRLEEILTQAIVQVRNGQKLLRSPKEEASGEDEAVPMGSGTGSDEE